MHDGLSTNSHLQANLASSLEYEPQIEAAIQREKPDLFILDHFLISPAIQKSGIPWVYLFSANPLGLYDSEKLPPMGAGRCIVYRKSLRELEETF